MSRKIVTGSKWTDDAFVIPSKCSNKQQQTLKNTQERLNSAMKAAQYFISQQTQRRESIMTNAMNKQKFDSPSVVNRAIVTEQENLNEIITGAGDPIRAINFEKNMRHPQLAGIHDTTCRFLFADASNLLVDIFNHPMSLDYFNVYLSLPIFAQRVFVHRTTHQFEFDPPMLAKYQTCDQLYEEVKAWLINCRVNNYVYTDLYLESLLGLLLMKIPNISIEQDKSPLSLKTHTFVGSKEPEQTTTPEYSYVFSTVMDVRHFYQFLESTDGMKYWNYFIDTMKLLRSRHAMLSERIDTSYLNFFYEYYSRRDEFRSIAVNIEDFNNGISFMPDSNTSDAVWFQMAVNAVDQLRTYWLPRYLAHASSQYRLKSNTDRTGQLVGRLSLPTNITLAPPTTSDFESTVELTMKDPKLTKVTIGNISYFDYNPRQYLPIQSSSKNKIEHDFEEVNKPNVADRDDATCKIVLEFEKLSSSFDSIADYISRDNIELFYRILVSDSLAAWPFLQYISQTLSVTESLPLQHCLRFIADAEVIIAVSIHSQLPTTKQRLRKQFISRYLGTTASRVLPMEIFANDESLKQELIDELTSNDHAGYSLLWKMLLKTTEILIPHLINYLKFDRLYFLVQGKPLSESLVFDDLSRLLPTVNFDMLREKRRLMHRQKHEETEFHQSVPNWQDYPAIEKTSSEIEPSTRCGGEPEDLVMLRLFGKQYDTTEKQVNTDEKCQFRMGERVRQLNSEEFRDLCTTFNWRDAEIAIGNQFDGHTIARQTDMMIFIGDPLSRSNIQRDAIPNDWLAEFFSESNPIEKFTLEVMNAGREIVEADRFVSSILDESVGRFQTLTRDDGGQNSYAIEDIFMDSSPLTSSIQEKSSQLMARNANENPLALFKRLSTTDKNKHSQSTLSFNRSMQQDVGKDNSSRDDKLYFNRRSMLTKNLTPNTRSNLDQSTDMQRSFPREIEGKTDLLCHSHLPNEHDHENKIIETFAEVKNPLIDLASKTDFSISPTVYAYLTENHAKSIHDFSLHRHSHLAPSSFSGCIQDLTINPSGIGTLRIDLPQTEQKILPDSKLILYTNNQEEFLFADVLDSTIDSNGREFHLHIGNFQLPTIRQSSCPTKNLQKMSESLKFAPLDKSNEVNFTFVEQRQTSYLNNTADRMELLEFIRNEIDNRKWPIGEYIGIRGQRAWRALKLATDISHFDVELMVNYHREIDWHSTDNNFGSFSERTDIVVRSFEHRTEWYRKQE